MNKSEIKLLLYRKRLEPQLSICIPTLDRPKEFNTLLSKLSFELNNSIEIVVRDDSENNKSVMSFKKILKDYTFQYQYFRGKPEGLDKANLFLLEKARGKFIWWFGDDDLLINNGITHILEFTKYNPNISFIWANFGQGNSNKLACSENSRFFENLEDVLTTLGHNIGLLSTYILNRKHALQHLNYGYSHVRGFAFASTAIVLATIAGNNQSYLMKGPFVLNKPSTIDELKGMMAKDGEEYHNNAFTTYGVHFREIIDGKKKYLSFWGYYKVMKKIFNPVWKGIFVAWIGGWDNPKGKRMKMLRLYWFLPECWLAIIIFIIPKLFNKLLYKVYKYFYKKRVIVQ